MVAENDDNDRQLVRAQPRGLARMESKLARSLGANDPDRARAVFEQMTGRTPEVWMRMWAAGTFVDETIKGRLLLELALELTGGF